MQTLNQNTKQFIKELSYVQELVTIPASDEFVETSKAASTLAIVYESARNAVEFRADHLIRQAAIERILKRRLFLNQKSQRLASLLIKELLWARYLKKNSIASKKIKELSNIIDKYRYMLSENSSGNKADKDGFSKWILQIASCEIEEALVFDPVPQILVNYVFQSLSQAIDFDEDDAQTKSIQIYIAVERGFAQNNEGFISFRLIKSLLPGWFDPSSDVGRLKEELYKSYQEVKTQLQYPLAEALKRQVVALSPPFNLIREMLDRYTSDFALLSQNPEGLRQAEAEVLDELYDETRDKLSRASLRSIVYIFLTKMLVALSLELPFDLYLGSPNYLALGVNLAFPPFLMFVLNANIPLPEKENTANMLNLVDEYFYSADKPKLHLVSQKAKKQGMDKVFSAIYIATFVLIFGGIFWLLGRLGFNPVSQVIFLFFLSVVSFFAYRVRGIAKDFNLQKEDKESLASSFKDFVFLPIIKVGQWLSVQISNINILSFIFDFIIEAPLKVFLEVIEEWIHFVRVKKEEIVS
jgi:hypothetical protein